MYVANTLAYDNVATTTAVKSFIVQAPDVNVINVFFYLNGASLR
jgi:hypothetical protein